MRLLFTHDVPLMREGGQVYSSLDKNALLDKYAFLADDITFLCRETSSLKQRTAITYPHFSFIPVPNLNGVAALPRHLKQASRIIKEAVAQADIGIFRMPSLISFLAAHYAHERGLPYIIEAVSCPWDALWNHSMTGRAAAPFFTLAQRHLIRRAPYVVYVSERFLQERYPTLGRSLACSDVELPPEGAGEGILHRRLERLASMPPASPLVLGTAAALDVAYKGQRFVIEAMGRLRKLGMDIEYRLAGGGDASALLEAAERHGVRDRVHILGALPHEAVFTFHDELDVYVQPSLQEGMPRAVIEAMSRGCLVIGSSVGGIPELIPPSCVFERGNVDALERILAELWKSRARLSEYAKVCFARASSFRPAVLDEKRRNFYTLFLREQGLKGGV